jgi:hypothetical protein
MVNTRVASEGDWKTYVLPMPIRTPRSNVASTEGAIADLLLVDGDPTRDIEILADRSNLLGIMKGEKIYKNDVLP